MEPLDRATIWPYRDGEPGELYYQRYAHPNGARGGGASSASSRAARRSSSPPAPARRRRWCSRLLEPGQTIALAEGGYYGTGVLFDALERWGVRHVEFDQTGPPPDGADLVWLEAPSNPFLTMPDLEAAVASPARVVVDSTAATPVYLRPLEPAPTSRSTARRSSSAATTTCCSARSSCRSAEDAERLRDFRSRTGIVAAPDPCWLLSRSLKTLRRADGAPHRERDRDRRAAARPPGGRARPLPGLRRPALVRRRRRRGRSQGRDLAAEDQERHEPRRRRVGARERARAGRATACRPACCA